VARERPATAREAVAVIDIGSNSGRVMVYRREAAGHLHILAGSRASLRLARGMERSGRIEPEALERAFEALRDFRSIARGAGVRRIVAAGTSALREAANGPAFIRRVHRDLGLRIQILSGVEEARFGFLGAVGGLPADDGVLFDLGGGSLQVGRFRGRRLLAASSLPLGALRVSDAYLRSDPPTSREIRRLREHARREVEAAALAPLGPGQCLVGTGGTLRNLARVDQRVSGYPIPRLHGYLLTRRRLHEVNARLLGSRAKKRGRLPGLNADRRDSVVGGGLVIETLMDVLETDEIVVSGQGVREGLAMSLARESLAPADTTRRISLDALAARFAGWSPERAGRRERLVTGLLEALFSSAPADLAEVLRLGARILDVGRTVDFFDRYDHVADLVLATDLAGFSHRQVALLAAVLRQAGDEDAHPRTLAPLVGREDRAAVARAAVLLAMADEITDRCPPGAPTTLESRRRAGEVTLRVRALESWGVRGLGQRFENAFGATLRVVPSAGAHSRRRSPA
jgi:exopolyphosphatase/guanosine-5'-triphosphate,3'-diphosphate pyrophosphatase